MQNMNRNIYIVISAVVVVLLVILGAYYLSGEDKSSIFPSDGKALDNAPTESEKTTEVSERTIAVMKTNFGDITLELFTKNAPKTVENFVKLSREGFYDGVKFHRVIKGFMIQGGDPKSKDDDRADDGTGGPGYVFPDEINQHKIVRGALAMANAGPNTNGSQFFIVTAEAASWLDGRHTVFGQVIGGMDVVFEIENVPTDKTAGDHPLQDVVITSVEIRN